MRRAVDQENARHRRQAKSTYQDMVRQLALFVRKRGPAREGADGGSGTRAEAKRAAAEALKLKKRQENLEARRKWREQGPVDDGYEARQGVTLADLDDKKEKATTTIYSLRGVQEDVQVGKAVRQSLPFRKRTKRRLERAAAASAAAEAACRLVRCGLLFRYVQRRGHRRGARRGDVRRRGRAAGAAVEAAPAAVASADDDATSSDSSDGDFVNPFAAAAADTSDEDDTSATSSTRGRPGRRPPRRRRRGSPAGARTRTRP